MHYIVQKMYCKCLCTALIIFMSRIVCFSVLCCLFLCTLLFMFMHYIIYIYVLYYIHILNCLCLCTEILCLCTALFMFMYCIVYVYVPQSLCLRQGARLTTWECVQDNIPCTLITDSMAGFLMKQV